MKLINNYRYLIITIANIAIKYSYLITVYYYLSY